MGQSLPQPCQRSDKHVSYYTLDPKSLIWTKTSLQGNICQEYSVGLLHALTTILIVFKQPTFVNLRYHTHHH